MEPQITTPRLENLNPFYRILAFVVAARPVKVAAVVDPGVAVADGPSEIRATGENAPVDLARVAWLLTVVACLVAVVILAVDGYLGYAGVTLAVALSAAINLTP